MARRVFICAKQNYPRRSAGANYIQYLSLAMNEVGYTPVVMSSGQYTECQNDAYEQKYLFRGMEFYNPFLYKNKYLKHIEFVYFDGGRFIQALKKYGAKNGDIIISYLMEEKTLRTIKDFAKKRDIRCAACVVEWLPPETFSNRKKYESYKNSLEQVIPEYNVILPITNYIASKYERVDSTVCVLPIMTDTGEFPYRGHDFETKIRLIFPANGMMKDSMKNMLEGLGKCPKEIRERLEFHITNYGEDKIAQDLAGCDAEIAKNLESIVFTHKWLEYDELVDLYKKMDFLLLARETNQLTLANFPSKVPESMTHGVIPIASRVGDYTNIYLKDGINSIIFDGCSAEDCIVAIKRAASLSETELTQMHNNARMTAENEFNYHNWVDKLETLFPFDHR